MAVARRGDGDPFPLRGTVSGEDPFPLKLTVKKQVLGRWVKGTGSYSAIQIGPFVRLTATGKLPYFNATAHLVKSPLTIFPPVYGLFFFIPEIQLPAQLPFEVHASFFTEETVNTILVWDAKGKHSVKVNQAIE